MNHINICLLLREDTTIKNLEDLLTFAEDYILVDFNRFY